jgi:hypothetical protein
MAIPMARTHCCNGLDSIDRMNDGCNKLDNVIHAATASIVSRGTNENSPHRCGLSPWVMRL